MQEKYLKNIINEVVKKNIFTIEDYKPEYNNWKYIISNKNYIWNFLNKGYQHVGYEKFYGCDNIRSLVKNASLIKIAFCGENIVAIAIYTSYLCGFKNVGITATTDEKYREIGINAVKKIIKTDISNFDQFFWSECSGTVERLYEKYNGIKIPNSYVPSILKRIIEPLEDGFHYIRKIKDDEQTKIIYGFNSIDTFNKVKQDRENYINQGIEKILSMQIDENIEKPSFGRLSRIDTYISVIYFFLDQRLEDECYEFPENSIMELRRYVTYLKKIILQNRVDKKKETEIRKAIETGEDLLETSSVMKAFVF